MNRFFGRRAAQVVGMLVLACVLTHTAAAQLAADRIRLNQVGFYPLGPKVAAVVDAPAGDFQIVSGASGEVVLTAPLGDERVWQWSDEAVRLADFSTVTAEGLYYLEVPGLGHSYPFVVAQRAHEEVARGALKALYFQRVSTPLEPEYAGAWARAAGHPDDQVEVHPSAESASRPAGTLIAAPGGWYDAGDYNKYIVPAAFTSYVMLAGLEHFPDYFEALETDIPESGNGAPDVLNEAVWNLRFMLDMQDPEDGGLYHKLTTANFQGTVAPHVPTATRYVVQKSTAATLDFAAAAAQLSRILADYSEAFPGLADSARTAALAAWEWARANPSLRYNQNQINQDHNPDISTGEYGDGNLNDEWAWAAAELYMTTGQDSFHQAVNVFSNNSTPGWASVNMLGTMTLAFLDPPTAAGADLQAEARSRIENVALQYRNHYLSSAMGTAIGLGQGNFGWGSTGTAGGIGMLLLQAYQLTGDVVYQEAAISVLDYLLGLNGTGYSFLTGYGVRPAVNPHHRPSASDQVEMPVPGLLAGGPNPGQQDNTNGECPYPHNQPAKSYVDAYCSYASNEITTYWNVPLLYLAAGLEHVMGNQPRSHAPPQAVGPVPFATGVSSFAAISWSATADYDRYEVQVATSPLFIDPEVIELVASEGTLAMVQPMTTYYWRVRGLSGEDASAWSSIGVFTSGVAGGQNVGFVESNGMVVVEAENEHGRLTRPGTEWSFFRRLQGQVGTSAYGGPNVGRTFGDAFRFESPMLYYNVRLHTPGTWYVWVRIAGSSEEDDEIHLGIDGRPITSADDPMKGGEPYGEWQWVNQTGTGARVTFDVAEPGRHTLNLWLAEDGVMIDRLLITHDPLFVPEGAGPAESAEVVAAELPKPEMGRLAIQDLYPLPASDVATVRFTTPRPGRVTMTITDVLGRLQSVEVDEVLPAGQHEHNISVRQLSAGSYYVRLMLDGASAASSLIVVR